MLNRPTFGGHIIFSVCFFALLFGDLNPGPPPWNQYVVLMREAVRVMLRVEGVGAGLP
jgi:hypothetical protein